jgi:DNA-binding response OmpR family regulator
MSQERTILIVDDNINLALGLAKLLRNAGYGVHTAHTAADRLKLALLHCPDAIILDFRMPSSTARDSSIGCANWPTIVTHPS